MPPIHQYNRYHKLTLRLSRELIRDLKGDSSKWINDKRLTKGHFEWQTGYGAFSYSHSQINDVVQYIINQEEHYRKRTFAEDDITFLQKFDITYDKRYVFKPLDLLCILVPSLRDEEGGLRCFFYKHSIANATNRPPQFANTNLKVGSLSRVSNGIFIEIRILHYLFWPRSDRTICSTIVKNSQQMLKPFFLP